MLTIKCNLRFLSTCLGFDFYGCYCWCRHCATALVTEAVTHADAGVACETCIWKVKNGWMDKYWHERMQQRGNISSKSISGFAQSMNSTVCVVGSNSSYYRKYDSTNSRLLLRSQYRIIQWKFDLITVAQLLVLGYSSTCGIIWRH